VVERIRPESDDTDAFHLVVMKDPVTLPISRVVIDRGTIRTVLLSKEVDPFNNVPYVLRQPGCANLTYPVVSSLRSASLTPS